MPLEFDGERVNCLTFSPDGKKIAAASRSSIWLWDARTDSYIGELFLDDVRVPKLVAFSPDGNILSAELMNGTFCAWDLTTMQPTEDPTSYIGFPDPYVYLRLREQWLFYKDVRTLWLPSEYVVPDDLPLTLRDGVLFCLGRICSTLDVSQTLLYLPSLPLTNLEHLHPFKVASVSSSEAVGSSWLFDSEFDPDLEVGRGSLIREDGSNS